jgi:peptide chain release factor subunit 1
VLKTFEEELLVPGLESKDPQRFQQLQQSVSILSTIAESDLVLAYVSKVELKDNRLNEEFVDIELPATGSFIGNGFVLHNSARRYERLREMELTDYFNRLADHAKKTFIDQHQVKGLIVSGPGPTKDEFVKDGYLDYRLQNAIVGVLDTGYSGREGVRETVFKSDKLLESVRVVEEKRFTDRFFRELNTDSGLAMYGIQDILNALKRSAVDTILVNDDADIVYLKATCKNCENVTEKFASRSQIVEAKQSLLICPNCGSNEVEIVERDIVDYLADASIDSGADVQVISSKTEGGSMMKNFGGVSALLRYRA